MISIIIVVLGYQMLRAKLIISTDTFRDLLLKIWLASKSISVTWDLGRNTESPIY